MECLRCRYAENDKYFSPVLAKRMHAAFVSGGGDAKLVIAPPFGKDGHTLFSLAGTSKWTPIVDQFIKSISKPKKLAADICALPVPRNQRQCPKSSLAEATYHRQ